MQVYLENVVGVELVNLVEYGPEVGCAGLCGDDELDPCQRLEALQLERVRLQLFDSRGWYRRNLVVRELVLPSFQSSRAENLIRSVVGRKLTRCCDACDRQVVYTSSMAGRLV